MKNGLSLYDYSSVFTIYKNFLCKKIHTLEKSLTQFKNQRVTTGQDSKDVAGRFFLAF